MPAAGIDDPAYNMRTKRIFHVSFTVKIFRDGSRWTCHSKRSQGIPWRKGRVTSTVLDPLRSARDDCVIDHLSKLVGAVRSEDEFELKENRVDFAIGKKEVRFKKIMIVLQAQLRKFSGVPA